MLSTVCNAETRILSAAVLMYARLFTRAPWIGYAPDWPTRQDVAWRKNLTFMKRLWCCLLCRYHTQGVGEPRESQGAQP